MIDIDFSKYSKEELQEIIQKAQRCVDFEESKKIHALWTDVVNAANRFVKETGINLYFQKRDEQIPVWLYPGNPGEITIEY